MGKDYKQCPECCGKGWTKVKTNGFTQNEINALVPQVKRVKIGEHQEYSTHSYWNYEKNREDTISVYTGVSNV